MKNFLLVSMCVVGLVFAGTAQTPAAAKKEPVKKEAAAPVKDVKKAKAKKTVVAPAAAVAAPAAAPVKAAPAPAKK